jgi:hypothetical protein
MFQRSGDIIAVEVTAQQARFLSQIPALLDSVSVEHEDPGYSVLHRPIYLDEQLIDVEVQAFASQEMETQRAIDRSVLERIAKERYVMTMEEAGGLLRALNEARLVLAARAGAFDGGPSWEDRIEEDPSLAAVAWLGYVQGELIAALTAGV